jgi:Protein of unknown function (DUF3106)
MRGNFMTGWMATAVLSAATVVASFSPCLAQGNYRPVQGRPPAQNQNHPQPHPPQAHAGDWLRRYKGLSPAEQERALQNDPGFRNKSPEQQQRLRQQLRLFSSLPPREQQRIVDNMDKWAHLTPEQKLQAREVYGRMQHLPPNRRPMVRTAIRDLSAMPPERREEVIDSNRFKKMFSPDERDVMRAAVRLPLVPQESGKSEEPATPEE